MLYISFSVVHYIYRVYACNLGRGTRLRRLYLFSTSFFHLVKVHVTSFYFLTMVVRHVDLLISLLPPFFSQSVYCMRASFGHFDSHFFECFDNCVLELSIVGVIRKTNEFHSFSSSILLLFCYSFFDGNHSSGKVVLWAIFFFK